jgi:hypothetical protein
MNPVWDINERTNDKMYTGLLSLFREVARNRMADHKHNKDVRQEVGIRVINNLAF